MSPRANLLLIAFVLLALLPLGEFRAAGAQETQVDIVVCPTCEVSDLAEAVSNAAPGSRIEVRGGTYATQLLIERDLELIGVDNPIIDGGGQGTVIRVTGAALTIEGFMIRNSGTSLDHEDSAVLVEKGQATVIDNLIEGTLFGIYLKESPGSIVRDNVIIGEPLPPALRGDGIRVWYCDDVLIEGNVAEDGRDAILWYSNRGVVRNNRFDRGRYGLHLMFSDAARIEGNSLNENSIGLYIMYSRDPHIVGNSMSNNRGPSGGGLGLKDVDRAIVEANRFVGNQIAAQVDTSPREFGIENYFTDNVFAYNEVGIGFMPSVRRNTLSGNSFIDNIVHVSVLGGGKLQEITWSPDGRGNYWSDYAGYDANGDGVGDVPYRSQKLFESLMDAHPSFRLFIFSPAAMAIDFAARAVPSVRPETRFEDTAPLMEPPAVAGLPPVEQAGMATRLGWAGAGLAVVLGAATAASAIRRRPARHTIQQTEEATVRGMQTPHAPAAVTGPEGESAAIVARGLTKRYGKVAAVDDMTFAIRPGDAVALWGPNGAGKTTILRCLLGLARYSGHVMVEGLDPARQGRETRQAIGYVPQDLAPSAMTVAEMTAFIAKLKGVALDDARERLVLLGIEDAADKPVSALSGGMKQRLALALALIGAPSILLLDEPTANLDAAGRADLLNLLRRLKADGMTLVFSSHRPDDVLTLADRILLIERGVLQEELTPAAFATSLDAGSRLVVALKNGHMNEALETLTRLGYEPVRGGDRIVTVGIHPTQKAEVLMALAREGVDIADFELERMS
ncbi:MAG TPA: nitrous oxide reductase family maturation protein NosD [Thermomicrobiales bacterium]|nr:nitrous oxide reductase family maturation protein NosD [Thermomicrobiales bacterium]